MGAGLSLFEQIEEFRKSRIEPRVGSAWLGRLEEWLAAVIPPGADERYEQVEPDDGAEPDDRPGDDESMLEWTERRRAGVQVSCFSASELRAEYLQSVTSRSEADVLALLRLFLFEESCFGGDSEYLHQTIYANEDLSALGCLPTEYRRHLMMWLGGSAKPHPSIRWALDLLPHSPQQAIDAITGYLMR